MARARACACACAALLAWPALASADVLSVAGDVVHATPPSSDLRAGNNASPTAWAFLEYPRFGVDVAAGDRFYGEIPVGRWGAGAPPPTDAGVMVSAMDTFASHLIHVDADESGRRYRGTVTFDAEIVAIFVSDTGLAVTDLAPRLATGASRSP